MRSRRGAWTIGVAPAVLSLQLVAAPAPGAESSAEVAALPIALEVEGCEAIDQAELQQLLAIEFRTLDVLPREPRERVHVQCTARRAVVRLESGSTSNEVDLRATAQALWPRLLALSVSELVTESRARATPLVSPATPQPIARPPSAPRQASRDHERVRAFAGVSLRRALRSDTWLAGPELGAALDLNRSFSLTLDLRLELGRTDTEWAQVDWLSASSGLVLLAGGRVGDFRLAAGPGVCVGYLHLSPNAKVAGATEHAVSGVWAGPELMARVRYDLGGGWFALGSLGAGFASTSVTGLVNGEQRAIDTGGAWLTSMLGAGLVL
ncbi:MAG TPA: hypothetical protein VHM25_05890 [Polyangiaceae bacterium]|jgi:hypothetical protein|nr:hypothetical protein [Polyangiaceae bacterium]